jgi:hypothetical protein
VEANRRNAQRSTGPRTAEGKAKVAANALKHGLLAQTLPSPLHGPALPGEHAQFQSTLAALTAGLAPSGQLEFQLVERLASLQLRLTRIARIESGIFTLGIDDALRYRPIFKEDDAAALQQHPTDRLLGAAYQSTSTQLHLLSNYEARLSREFHRTLAELRQAQRQRIDARRESASASPQAPTPPGESEPASAPAPSQESPQAGPHHAANSPAALPRHEIRQTNPIPSQTSQAMPLGSASVDHPAPALP